MNQAIAAIRNTPDVIPDINLDTNLEDLTLDQLIELTRVPSPLRFDVIEITPDVAKVLLKFNTPGPGKKNRNVKWHAVRHYADDMRQGRWLLTGQPIIFDKHGIGARFAGAYYLLPIILIVLGLFMVSPLYFPKIAKRKTKLLNLIQFPALLSGYVCGFGMILPEYMYALLLIYGAVGFIYAFIHRAEYGAGRIPDSAAAEPGAVKTESGLVYRELSAGTGESPKATDTVKVHYRGTLVNGAEFDSSYKRSQPAQFPLNGVVKCWTEGVQRMKVGGKSMLACPSDLAYGDQGRPSIPGGATLIFEIELLEIVAAK